MIICSLQSLILKKRPLKCTFLFIMIKYCYYITRTISNYRKHIILINKAYRVFLIMIPNLEDLNK